MGSVSLTFGFALAARRPQSTFDLISDFGVGRLELGLLTTGLGFGGGGVGVGATTGCGFRGVSNGFETAAAFAEFDRNVFFGAGSTTSSLFIGGRGLGLGRVGALEDEDVGVGVCVGVGEET